MKNIILKGGDHAVLLFYGLGGSPLEVISLATRLNQEGYAVEIPSIQGYEHAGKTGEIFKPYETWIDQAVNYFHEMKKRYQKISIGGLSLGSSVSLRLAEILGDQVESLLLLSTTLYIDGWSIPWYQMFIPVIYFSPWRRKIFFSESEPYGIKNPERRQLASQGMKENGVSITGGAKISLFKIYQARQLNKIIIKNLNKIICPVLIIHAREDDTASLKNMEVIGSKISAGEIEKLILEDSYHIITVDNEREKVMDACIKFLKKF